MFGSGSGSVRVEFGSGMFRVVYGNLVRIGYGLGFGSGWIRFNLQINVGSGVNRVRQKLSPLISGQCIFSMCSFLILNYI